MFLVWYRSIAIFEIQLYLFQIIPCAKPFKGRFVKGFRENEQASEMTIRVKGFSPGHFFDVLGTTNLPTQTCAMLSVGLTS